MIVRVFRVWVTEGHSDEWQRMFEDLSVPWMKAQEGCVAFYPGKAIGPDGREFSMISVWKDADAIRAAVGENWQEAILFGDEARIAERIEMVHYDLLGT